MTRTPSFGDEEKEDIIVKKKVVGSVESPWEGWGDELAKFKKEEREKEERFRRENEKKEQERIERERR